MPELKRYRDDEYLILLGDRVRKLRTAKGFSIDRIIEVGNGLHGSTVSRIENGKTDPQLSTLKRIADIIGVTLLDLLDTDQ